MRRVVLDASAVLALILDEPGAGAVRVALQRGAVMSTVNLAEVAARLRESDWPTGKIEANIARLNVAVIPLGRRTALMSGDLRPVTRRWGLGLGDRSCLALAQELGLPAVTADRVWGRRHIAGIEVRLIR